MNHRVTKELVTLVQSGRFGGIASEFAGGLPSPLTVPVSLVTHAYLPPLAVGPGVCAGCGLAPAAHAREPARPLYMAF